MIAEIENAVNYTNSIIK